MLELQPFESSTLMTSGNKQRSLTMEQPPNFEHGKTDSSKGINKEDMWCTYCKKPRHTKERCWKLHGKPLTASREWGAKGSQQQGQQNHSHMTSQTSQTQ